ncbi:MAG: PHP domain-containing protein [Anaeroplasmataceae bacterium]|nr:PHP domain-containing protein [Anaeroplasmataceae bacterium]
MIKANYHSHLFYCNHAVGNAKDYIEVALKAGFKEIGITDHAPVFAFTMTEQEYHKVFYHKPMLLDQMYQQYLPELEVAKKTYKNQIKVLSGFETEYIPANAFFLPVLRKAVDYLNLGVHYFEYKNKIYDTYHDVNYETIYGYLDACIKGMETHLFNTLVHPDLFMFSYQSENGKRVFDEHCEYVTKRIIECAIQNDVYLEINANGIKNSKRFSKEGVWLYPNKEFWMLVKQYPSAKIIIGADAHSPDDLAGDNVLKVEQFAKDLKLNVLSFMEVKKYENL